MQAYNIISSKYDYFAGLTIDLRYFNVCFFAIIFIGFGLCMTFFFSCSQNKEEKMDLEEFVLSYNGCWFFIIFIFTPIIMTLLGAIPAHYYWFKLNGVKDEID